MNQAAGSTAEVVESSTRPGRAEVNAVAWLVWLGGVACLPLVSRNPLYLALELVVVTSVYLSLPRRDAAARAWRLFVLIGLSVTALSIGFNVLTVHVGQNSFAELPNRLPIIGGELTWNAFAYGAVSAIAISTLLIGAAAFNTAVRHGDLVRLMPGRLARLGIAGSIALTMVPQTIAAGRDIVDAQRARGHRVRGPRDAGSLIVPLLTVGLERAITLSEALEVRGFGSEIDVPAFPRRRIRMGLAVLALAGALLALGLGNFSAGVLGLAVACGLALASARTTVARTRLRRTIWNRWSVAVCVGAATTLGIVLASGMSRSTLAWDPFPILDAPMFDPIVGGALLGLLVPVFAPYEASR